MKQLGCKFCQNNRTNPEWELHEEQCAYAMGIGQSADGYRIMINKQPYWPLCLDFDCWSTNSKTPQWQLVGHYYPKYCPECGRKIDEYDRSKVDG